MAITRGADYDTTQAFGQGGFRKLPKGAYVVKIMKAEELKDRNGNPMIHIAFDIDRGEYKGFFMEEFREKKKKADKEFKEAKWPFEGQAWIGTQDYEDRTKTSRKFKGFCTALEDSDTKVWSDNGQFLLNNLKGAYVGVVYQNQEQEYNGKTFWRAVPWAFRSVESVLDGDDIFIPDDRPLDVGSAQQTGGAPAPGSGSAQAPAGFMAFAEDEDVPF